jgi:UDP-N-acetylglucosamine 2-epimerase
MSGVFFDGLDLPAPDFNLEVGSGQHGAQTAMMLDRLERVLIEQRPDWVLVYGDTNSTLAGALAAAKLHIKVCHVEAGLRSFNRQMPEEINRVLTDHVSELLLCPSQVAVKNLAAEGINRGVYIVGDIMQDVLLWAKERLAEKTPGILDRLEVREGKYLLATVHRSENTDAEARLSGILDAFSALDETIIFPAHPRTRKMIAGMGLSLGSRVRIVEPLTYFEMVDLAKSARMILTDSGGVQKEAYWLGVPCVTLRDETEWVETVSAGWNKLVGSDRDAIIQAVREFAPSTARQPLYGNGRAAAECVALLSNVEKCRSQEASVAISQ